MKALPETLDSWLRFIDATHPSSMALGLERVAAVANRLGVNPPAGRTVVVAGTNGKGSTCTFIEALLLEMGMRPGVTLSPHLWSFNERIRVAGQALDDAGVCVAMEAVEAVRGATPLTYFEYAILAALVAFRQQQVDVAVLEVGLGGRLDAVNIVDADVTVITSIGFDHMDYLGDDLETIGIEKAGILRTGTPLICGVDMPGSVLREAEALNVPVRLAGRDFASSLQGLESGTEIAPQNAALAVEAVTSLIDGDGLPAGVVERAARVARLPGRFERFEFLGCEVILDVAHNPHGAGFLANQLAGLPAVPTAAVAGFLKDKDVGGIVGALEDHIQDWTFVGTQGERGQSGADSLRQCATNSQRSSEYTAGQVIAGLAAGRTVERIVVMGSFDVVGTARRHLLHVGPGIDGDE